MTCAATNLAGRDSSRRLGGGLLRAVVCLALASGLTLACVHPAWAQSASDAAVKAAFVYNLTKYVEWPGTKKEFVIAVAGEGPMGGTLKTMLDGKLSESRSIRVVLSPTGGEMETCDLLYVSLASAKQYRPILEKLRSSSVLTVSDSGSFARQGGMIGLVMAGDHIAMEINLEAVQAAHLRVSSHLLALKSLVHLVSGAAN